MDQKSFLKQSLAKLLSRITNSTDPSQTEGRHTSQAHQLQYLIANADFDTSAIRSGVLNIYLIVGQSLSIGWNGSPVLSSTQPYTNLKIINNALSPLVEGDTVNSQKVESPASGLANYLTLINSDAQNAVVKNGIGGTSSYLRRKGTTAYNNAMSQVQAIVSEARARGLEVNCRGLILIEGENDQKEGIAGDYKFVVEKTYSDYNADLKAVTGQKNDLIMVLSQASSLTNSFVNASTADICIKQLQAVEDNHGVIYLSGSKQRRPYSDGLHLTNVGYLAEGHQIGKAISIIQSGETWNGLRPRHATISGNVITVRFHVPVPPLVFDTFGGIAAKANQGFEYFDDNSPPAISSVAIQGNTNVVITLASTPTGNNKRIRYAYTGTAGVNAGTTGAMYGNLRDSDTSQYDASGTLLYNECCHFDKAVFDDGSVPLTDTDIAGLNLSATPAGAGTYTAVTFNLPFGKRIPNGFKVSIGDGAGQSDFTIGANRLVTFPRVPTGSGNTSSKIYTQFQLNTKIDSGKTVNISSLAYTSPDLSSPWLWMRADTNTVVATNICSKWSDRLGSGRNFYQNIGSQRPLFVANAQNSQPALRLDGTDDFMTMDSGMPIGGSQSYTKIIALKPAMQIGGRFDNYLSGSNGHAMFMDVSGNLNAQNIGGSAFTNNTAVGILPTVFSVVYDSQSGTLSLFKKSVAAGSGSTTPNIDSVLQLGRYQNGSPFYGAFDVYEILLYERALSNTDRTAIENYLIARYNII